MRPGGLLTNDPRSSSTARARPILHELSDCGRVGCACRFLCGPRASRTPKMRSETAEQSFVAARATVCVVLRWRYVPALSGVDEWLWDAFSEVVARCLF